MLEVKETCVNCAWSYWPKRTKAGDVNYNTGGVCTLDLPLPNCYIDPSRPGDRCWPWKRPVTKYTRPDCKYWRKS